MLKSNQMYTSQNLDVVYEIILCTMFFIRLRIEHFGFSLVIIMCNKSVFKLFSRGASEVSYDKMKLY